MVAVMPADSGVARLVPPIKYGGITPLSTISTPVNGSASAAMSGTPL